MVVVHIIAFVVVGTFVINRSQVIVDKAVKRNQAGFVPQTVTD